MNLAEAALRFQWRKVTIIQWNDCMGSTPVVVFRGRVREVVMYQCYGSSREEPWAIVIGDGLTYMPLRKVHGTPGVHWIPCSDIRKDDEHGLVWDR